MIFLVLSAFTLKSIVKILFRDLMNSFLSSFSLNILSNSTCMVFTRFSIKSRGPSVESPSFLLLTLAQFLEIGKQVKCFENLPNLFPFRIDLAVTFFNQKMVFFRCILWVIFTFLVLKILFFGILDLNKFYFLKQKKKRLKVLIFIFCLKQDFSCLFGVN